MSNLGRDFGLISLPPAADHSALRGYAVKITSGEADLVDAVDDVPFGVIVEGAPETGRDSVAVCGSGLVVKVKCASSAGTINIGTYLKTTTAGTFAAVTGSGTETTVVRALEAGANNVLIEAVLLNPTQIAT